MATSGNPKVAGLPSSYPTVYGFWTNKGGVGRTTLTFHMATTYAKLFPQKAVVAIDMSPQCDLSATLLTRTQNNVRVSGDTIVTQMQENKIQVQEIESHGNQENDSDGNQEKEPEGKQAPRTISGYLDASLNIALNGNPSDVTMTPADYLMKCDEYNPHVPPNMWLVCGDNYLDQQAPLLSGVAALNPTAQGNNFVIVHYFIKAFIQQLQKHFADKELVVLIDTSPVLSIYTQIALCAMTQLIIPVSADTFSVQAVTNMYHQVYGLYPTTGRDKSAETNTFASKVKMYGMNLPRIAAFIRNRIPVLHENGPNKPETTAAFKAMGDEQVTFLYNGYVTATLKGELERVFRVEKKPGGSPRVCHSKQDFADTYLAAFRDMQSAGVAAMRFGLPIWQLSQQYTPVQACFMDQNVKDSMSGVIKDMMIATKVLLHDAWSKVDLAAKASTVAAQEAAAAAGVSERLEEPTSEERSKATAEAVGVAVKDSTAVRPTASPLATEQAARDVKPAATPAPESGTMEALPPLLGRLSC